jgi:hypothetical protein
MIIYNTLENGNLRGNGQESIPEGHRWYLQALALVESGDAQILPYTAPAKSPEQIRDEDLAALVLDLDGDGVRVIQCRPAKFAQDESNMRNAIEKMARDGVSSRLWYMADNVAHQVTSGDLQAAIVSGQDQADAVWTAFFQAISSE